MAIVISPCRYSAFSSGDPEECSQFSADLQRFTFEAMDIIIKVSCLYMGVILYEVITGYLCSYSPE